MQAVIRDMVRSLGDLELHVTGRLLGTLSVRGQLGPYGFNDSSESIAEPVEVTNMTGDNWPIDMRVLHVKSITGKKFDGFFEVDLHKNRNVVVSLRRVDLD